MKEYRRLGKDADLPFAPLMSTLKSTRITEHLRGSSTSGETVVRSGKPITSSRGRVASAWLRFTNTRHSFVFLCDDLQLPRYQNIRFSSAPSVVKFIRDLSWLKVDFREFKPPLLRVQACDNTKPFEVLCLSEV